MTDKDTSTYENILFKLGEMNSSLGHILTRMDSIESDHKHDHKAHSERLNNHSERLKTLEEKQAEQAGEQNGKRTTIGLVITCILLSAGFFAWLFANGLNVLQAGAG